MSMRFAIVSAAFAVTNDSVQYFDLNVCRRRLQKTIMLSIQFATKQ